MKGFPISWLAPVAGLAFAGCAAVSYRPMPTTRLSGDIMDRMHGQTVLVTGSRKGDIDAVVFNELRSAGLFAGVTMNSGHTTDWVIEVHASSVNNTSGIVDPMLSAFTLGILPYYESSDRTYVFDLRNRVNNQTCRIGPRSFKIRRVWGWIGGPLALLPSWERDTNLLEEVFGRTGPSPAQNALWQELLHEASSVLRNATEGEAATPAD